MNIGFSNKFVLVTGGTRGIGKKIVEDFYNEGANLIITGVNQENIISLNENNENRKKFIKADFSSISGIKDFISNMSSFEKIDICINNAGINKINYINETELEDIEKVFNVNLMAPYMITRAVASIMKKNRFGRIINIGSIFGHLSKEKRSTYSTTKFGIKGLTVSSAIDLAKFNILVNNVAPGFVNTELTQKILSKDDQEYLLKQIPLNRFAEPEEISKIVMFLASEVNTYLTGQTIIVDGGFVNV